MSRRVSSIGSVDAAFRLYREHFFISLLLSLVFGVPAAVVPLLLWRAMSHLDALSTPAAAPPGSAAAVLPAVVPPVAVALFGLWIAIAGAAVGVGAAARIATSAARGTRPTLRDALFGVWHHLRPLTCASLLAAGAAVTGLVLLVVPGILLLSALAFVGPIVLLEDACTSRALTRSWRLTRGRRLKILGTLLLCSLVAVVPASSAGALTTVAGSAVGADAATVVGAVALPLALGAAAPLWYLAAVLLYYDARAEEDGLDIGMTARAQESEAEQRV